ncbi:MAG: hypothetical protein N2235_10050 [Fischerella sp.]|nr:hypothetical protein [Fischerella sp.]
MERWSFCAQYLESTELNHLCMLDEAKCFTYPPYAPLAVINYPYLERFRFIQCPTLVLSGTEDIRGLVKSGLAQAENEILLGK